MDVVIGIAAATGIAAAETIAAVAVPGTASAETTAVVAVAADAAPQAAAQIPATEEAMLLVSAMATKPVSATAYGPVMAGETTVEAAADVSEH